MTGDPCELFTCHHPGTVAPAGCGLCEGTGLALPEGLSGIAAAALIGYRDCPVQAPGLLRDLAHRVRRRLEPADIEPAEYAAVLEVLARFLESWPQE